MANPRVDRVAETIRSVVGDILIRQAIKDPRVWNAGIITVTHVALTRDLREARITFMVHGADDKKLQEVAEGLNHAAGFVRHRLRKELPIKVIPTVEFEVDRVFGSEEKVDRILHEIAMEEKGRQVAADGESESDADGRRDDDASD